MKPLKLGCRWSKDRDAIKAEFSRGTDGAIGEMKIGRCSFEVRVPQQLLNHEQTHCLIQQMGCKCVA